MPTSSNNGNLCSVPIRNRYTNEVQFTAQVDCAPDAPLSLRIGLAVRWGIAEKANLRSADLRSADLRSANLRSANLNFADLSFADLRSANLCFADLSSTNLSSARLRSVNLCSADLCSADLRFANLHSADLRSADLHSANLTSANLRFANLTSANLHSADLTSADLRFADLRFANLTSANLTSANLYGYKLARMIARADRLIGPYQFTGLELEAGGYRVLAGCRWFTPEEFVAHVAAEYPDTDKARETLAILDFIAVRAKALGVIH